MNLLLVNPPSPFLLDQKVFPPLGIMKVAADLDAPLLDLAGEGDYLDVLGAALDGYTHVGVGATTPQLPFAAAIARRVREVSSAKVILGGSHATVASGGPRPDKSLPRLFDHVIADDGAHGLRGLAGGPSNGTAYPEGNDWGRDRLDIESYRYEIDGHRATSLISQFGCPFACGFCCGRSIPFYRHVKYRQHEDVIAEIRRLYLRYGFTGFMFYDDEMNVNPKMIAFMGMLEDLQAELGVEFRFRGFVKAGIFTQAHADAMYRAGFRWLLCGFEGADPKLLLNINKKATVADNTEMVEFAKRAGMKVKALMSIGHPGESPASVRAVEDWLLAVAPDDFDCTVITPYPGSPYFDKAQKQGDVWRYEVNGDALYMDEIDYTVESDFYKGMQGSYISHVYTDHLSRPDIVAARDALESSVRGRLGIPYPGLNQFEHSMGQQ